MNRFSWILCLLLTGCSNSKAAYYAVDANREGTVRVLSAAQSRDIMAEDEAEQAAQAWLNLLDKNQIEKAWDQGSEFLRDSLERTRAVSTIRASRQRLGPLIGRQSLLKSSVHQLPGAPPGNYVVLRYRTSFKRAGTFQETVTMSGAPLPWRVAGYFMTRERHL